MPSRRFYPGPRTGSAGRGWSVLLASAIFAGTLMLWCCGCQGKHPRKRPASITQPATTQVEDFQISAMHVQITPASPFLYTTIQTTYRTMAEPVEQLLSEMRDLASRKHITFTGPPTLVYKGATEDRDRLFDLDVGFPVPDGTAIGGKFKVRTLAPFHCAAVLYTGPLESAGKAYQQLIPAMIAAGFTPVDETRDVYLLLQGRDSLDNVVQVQVGIR